MDRETNDEGHQLATYATEEEANEGVKELEAGNYYCESGDAFRPTYRVWKFRGKNTYGIRVTRYTVQTKKKYKTSWASQSDFTAIEQAKRFHEN